MNKVNLIGRLVRDPELKKSEKGNWIARFTIAVNSYNKGEQKADFISCVAFSKTAEIVGKFLSKGKEVALSGSISTGSYESKDGSKKYYTDIIVDSIYLIGRKNDKEQGDTPSYPGID